MATEPRIFFDTNEGDHEHGYWLTLPLSVVDLAAIANEPSEGMLVTIYMPEELEMKAILHRNDDTAIWIAIPVPNSIRYL